MIIRSLDTETTGLDQFHGCGPFFATMFKNGDDYPECWEWDVDPLTRKIKVPASDLLEIEQRIEETDELVLQNAKFDIVGLIRQGLQWREEWWAKVQDTLFAGHLLASGEPHDLTTMALRYLRMDIKPLEDQLEAVIKECRDIARREFPHWKIAQDAKSDKANPDNPSATKKLHKWDMWLGRAIAEAKKLPKDHRFRTALPEYSNGDSFVSTGLWIKQKELLIERGLMPVYEKRRELVRVIVEMETNGVTFNHQRLEELREQFKEEAEESTKVCISLSNGVIEKLPKSGTTPSMRQLLFDVWKLVPLDYSEKTGVPSVDKFTLDAWDHELPKNSKPGVFVRHLKRKRKRDTAVSYMDSYERFGIKMTVDEWMRLHPSLNATGSVTLRFSSQSPNEQNISKQEDGNLRYIFGPAPGREWWSIDYENIELYIPAYEAEEQAMIELFEHPEVAPYFGSYHLLVAHVLHPREFEQCLLDGVTFKKRYASTLYQWVKNGNFAVQYGAIEASGTADRAYHVPGAQKRIQERFKNIAKLNQHHIEFARKHGYVLTMQDRECGAYPIECTRDGRGRVLPTVPLNYHTQGTAMWCMGRAMVRCNDYLRQYNAAERAAGRLKGQGAFITMQIHDEMVFDLPARAAGPNGKPGNYNTVMKLRSLMEESGNDIGIPLKAKADFHPVTWAKGLAV